MNIMSPKIPLENTFLQKSLSTASLKWLSIMKLRSSETAQFGLTEDGPGLMRGMGRRHELSEN